METDFRIIYSGVGVKSKEVRKGAPGWLSWEIHVTLDLRAVSSSPTLGAEPTKKKRKKKRKKKQRGKKKDRCFLRAVHRPDHFHLTSPPFFLEENP